MYYAGGMLVAVADTYHAGYRLAPVVEVCVGEVGALLCLLHTCSCCCGIGCLVSLLDSCHQQLAELPFSEVLSAFMCLIHPVS